jgi:hypothetical protein
LSSVLPETDKKNISRKGPRNRGSLGFARDDKKERIVVKRGPLPRDKAVVDRPFNHCPLLRRLPSPLATALSLQQPSPFCHPERTRISYFTALTSANFVVLPKENHMQLTEATTLDRKSGEAEGSAVPRALPGNVFLVGSHAEETDKLMR